MTDIKTSFVSSETTLQAAAPDTLPEVGPKTAELPHQNGLVGCNVESTSIPFVVKTPRADSKLIRQNMEEVLNSVKKKHRQKHRRKREQKRLAKMEAEAAAKNGGVASPVAKYSKSEKRHHKKPLQEKSDQQNGLNASKSKQKDRNKSPRKSVPINASILKHFSPTSKHNEEADVEVVEPSNVISPTKTAKTTNAFEVMMNARNKTIGSNTPGKEIPVSPVVGEEGSSINVTRKAMLQDWADKKGGAKRKLDEQSRLAYVEKQLENRAKRFKQMLVSGTSSKSITHTSNNEKLIEDEQKKNAATYADHNHDGKLGHRKRRLRKRRFSSMQPVESLNNTEEVYNTEEAETTSFLSKLSSPTKKRDSLFGYFLKKDSPQGEAKKLPQLEQNKVINSKSENPNRRSRRATKNVETPEVVEVDNLDADTTISISVLEDKEASTPTGRPKRSCVGKPRYDHNFQQIDIKTGKKMKDSPNPCTKPLKSHEDEVIDLNETSSSTTPQQTPKKLAPLFVRAVVPKPSADPFVLKARLDFLRSGVPEKLRLEQVKQKQCEHNFEEALEFFPKVSHVQQLSPNETEILNNNKSIQFELKPFLEELTIHGSFTRKTKGKVRYCIGSITNCTIKNFRMTDKVKNNEILYSPLPILENKRVIIKAWKADFDRFPSYKCYNQLREKYRYFSAIDSGQDTEQVTESFVVTRRTRRTDEMHKKFDPEAEEEKPPPTAPNGELLYTEKYKPMRFEQVLVNLTPVTQLREFLSNWSNGSGGASVRNSQTTDDSMDFISDSNSTQYVTCNSVVLLGPISSGKTNAVFALANEMNFNVLEINAGMKRTGKKVIQELQEATQSHQIRKKSSQKHNLKMSANNRKSRKHSPQSVDGDSSHSAELSESARKCLILIEDADVVFEQTDAGFTEAINTLAASSKRPVIVVASNPNCQYLQRLMSQNTISFTAPSALNISKFLSVLSLIENCPIILDDLISLYLYNRNDLRKTLLELQFFIQSGGDRQHLQTRLSRVKSETNKPNRQFFASPKKRRFSDDNSALQTQENDDLLGVTKKAQQEDSKDMGYMHRMLFEFYTMGQNEYWRIPFPVDFHLMRVNLSDIFEVSLKLNPQASIIPPCPNTAKRRSRSPKKAWLNSATIATKDLTPLDNLCDFYENISVAALLGTCNKGAFADTDAPHFADRVVPYLAEHISHELVDKAIQVNLEADVCPYNLFYTPKNKQSLCDKFGNTAFRTKRALSLDFEPALRTICRSEKIRATQERRSTRFYHYLRSNLVNQCSFSMDFFDTACDIFQDNAEEETSTNKDAETFGRIAETRQR